MTNIEGVYWWPKTFGICLAGLILMEFSFPSFSQQFNCVEKLCKQMNNCAEAYFHLEQCGESIRDRDDDGIPCENVCGNNHEIMNLRLKEQGYVPGLGVRSRPPTLPSFSCDIKKNCRQMVSCEEAEFHLRECKNSKLDGNKDGIPCNSLCR